MNVSPEICYVCLEMKKCIHLYTSQIDLEKKRNFNCCESCIFKMAKYVDIVIKDRKREKPTLFNKFKNMLFKCHPTEINLKEFSPKKTNQVSIEHQIIENYRKSKAYGSLKNFQHNLK